MTVVKVFLNRIGSTTSGFGHATQHSTIAEAPDSKSETLRKLVIRIAEENGEVPGRLEDILYEPSYSLSSNETVFKTHGPGMRSRETYATCETFTALKTGGRYFKLQELSV